MDRRQFLQVLPSTIVVTTSAIPAVQSAPRSDVDAPAMEAAVWATRDSLRRRLGSDAAVRARCFTMFEQPGILIAASFMVETGRSWWARPAILSVARYGWTHDVDIVRGNEVLDLSLSATRLWDEYDPETWLGRWRMLLDDAEAAIIARALGEMT